MATPKALNDRSTAKHTHPPPIPTDVATEKCPMCGQPITKADYSRIQKQIESQVVARIEEAQRTLRENYARQVKAETEKARRAATKAAEQQVRAALAAQENIINQRLQAQRATLDKATSAAVNAE